MKIIYGIAGEGQGHLSRSKEIMNHLKKKGHNIKVITYGQAYGPLLSTDFSPIKINGIHPIYKKNKIKLTKSILINTIRVLKDLKRWKEINKKVRDFSPDLFITDFEPYTARLAYRNKKPLISIDNEHLLLQEIPKKIRKDHAKDFMISRYALRFCVPKSDLFVILSFHKTNLKSKKSLLIPPVIREEIINARPKKGSNILVYLSKPDKKLEETLKAIPEKFIIYGYDLNKKESNLFFKKNNEDFIKNLSSCKAIIATAGFSLISEAIFLKKPYFALPYYHFEQTLNAYFIKEQGFGEFSKHPTTRQITSFLSNLQNYEKNLKKAKKSREDPLEIINKVIEKIGKNNV